MLIEGKFRLKAPIEEVWDFLLKPETLASCIPGCEKVEIIDEKTYNSIVKQKVGPISVRFKFTTTLTEIAPPTHLKAVGSGSAMNNLGNFRQETNVDLKEVPEEEVEISYKSNVSIVGRLATFGDRIMRAKAKKVGDEFTRALEVKLKGRHL
jgi:hypothetical protein